MDQASSSGLDPPVKDSTAFQIFFIAGLAAGVIFASVLYYFFPWMGR